MANNKNSINKSFITYISHLHLLIELFKHVNIKTVHYFSIYINKQISSINRYLFLPINKHETQIYIELIIKTKETVKKLESREIIKFLQSWKKI